MGPHRLLVTDLDGTLLGDDDALGRFAEWHAAHAAEVRLVFATGRSRDSVDELVATTALPAPDAIIGAVGTEIHDPAGRPWPGWWERFTAFDAERVRRTLANGRLRLQPPAAQTDRKASFDAPDLSRTELDAVARRLIDDGLEATLVYSAALHLDVLPLGAGKGAAARTIADAWRIDAEEVLVAGDSGNDVQLFEQGFRGTIVANAWPDLRAAVGPSTYRSPYPYAAGVLDGIRFWTADAGAPSG